jgi:hypothetical protein
VVVSSPSKSEFGEASGRAADGSMTTPMEVVMAMMVMCSWALSLAVHYRRERNQKRVHICPG